MTTASLVRLLRGSFGSSTSAPAWCSLAVEVGGFFSPIFAKGQGSLMASLSMVVSVVWPAASDLLSSLVLHKMAAMVFHHLWCVSVMAPDFVASIMFGISYED
jgi:hypothetical protein